MWTSVLVVVVRPFQLLLSSLALTCACLDQVYLNSRPRLYIAVFLLLPATLAAVSVSIWTSLSYRPKQEVRHMHLILKWIADLVIFGLNGVAVAFTVIVDSNGVEYNIQPLVPLRDIFLASLCINASLFLATAVVLMLEHCWRRKGRRQHQEVPVIVHTSHEKASPSRLFRKKSDNSVLTNYSFGHPYDNPYRIHQLP